MQTNVLLCSIIENVSDFIVLGMLMRQYVNLGKSQFRSDFDT